MDSLLKSIKFWWKGQLRQTSPSTSPTNCLNCEAPLTEDAQFCYICGQKARPAKLTLWEMVQTSLNTVIGYDTRLWVTLKYILIPGRLAQMFQSGKRVQILHPLRLFFFLFLLVGLSMQNELEEFVVGINDGAIVEIHLSPEDSLELERRKMSDNDLELFVLLSTDSVCSEFVDRRILKEAENEEELYEMANLPNERSYLFARKQLKFLWDENAYRDFIAGNLIWVLLLLQPILSFFMKLILRKHYYSDHLIWSLYLHSSIFMAFLLVKLLMILFPGWEFDNGLAAPFAGIVVFIPVFLAWSLKRFYHKGWIISLLILLYISIVYMIVSVVTLLMNLLIGFLIF